MQRALSRQAKRHASTAMQSPCAAAGPARSGTSGCGIAATSTLQRCTPTQHGSWAGHGRAVVGCAPCPALILQKCTHPRMDASSPVLARAGALFYCCCDATTTATAGLAAACTCTHAHAKAGVATCCANRQVHWHTHVRLRPPARPPYQADAFECLGAHEAVVLGRRRCEDVHQQRHHVVVVAVEQLLRSGSTMWYMCGTSCGTSSCAGTGSAHQRRRPGRRPSQAKRPSGGVVPSTAGYGTRPQARPGGARVDAGTA